MYKIGHFNSYLLRINCWRRQPQNPCPPSIGNHRKWPPLNFYRSKLRSFLFVIVVKYNQKFTSVYSNNIQTGCIQINQKLNFVPDNFKNCWRRQPQNPSPLASANIGPWGHPSPPKTCRRLKWMVPFRKKFTEKYFMQILNAEKA